MCSGVTSPIKITSSQESLTAQSINVCVERNMAPVRKLKRFISDVAISKTSSQLRESSIVTKSVVAKEEYQL